MDLKKARKEVQTRRLALRSTQILWRSGRAVGFFEKSLHQFGLTSKCPKIALYKSLPGELGLGRLERNAALSGAQLFYPKITDSERCQLEFFAATRPDAWSRGKYGLLEPLPERAEAQLVPHVLEPDVFLVPGLLFGRGGQRVGFGKGYYDRYLSRFPQVLRIGFCFEFQLFNDLPQLKTDQQMDWIVTDREVIQCGLRSA